MKQLINKLEMQDKNGKTHVLKYSVLKSPTETILDKTNVTTISAMAKIWSNSSATEK